MNRIGIIMYKICNGPLPEVMNVLYVRNKDIHSNNTRSSNLLRVDSTKEFNNLGKDQYSIVECVTDEY